MTRPDFGWSTITVQGAKLTCKYVAPGLTMQDISKAFYAARSKAGPHDGYSANPNKWPDQRGITAVVDLLLDAIYGADGKPAAGVKQRRAVGAADRMAKAKKARDPLPAKG